MQVWIIFLLLFFSGKVQSQQMFHNRVFTVNELEKPPLYPFGTDSCNRFYLSHFDGFDTVLTKTIEKGDTAKYIRVYFSFVIANDGSIYDPHFEGIGSTRYLKSKSIFKLKYFNANKQYFDRLIKQMMAKMTFWKPGLYRGSRVDCKVIDYIQFWVGINPPVI
jgi:hypothetical protein